MTSGSPLPHATRIRLLAAAACLVALVVAVYAPVRHAGFLSLDDTIYVSENPFVRDGLTADGVRHALFGSRGALWLPLSFVSHMVDVSLFGLDPRGHHLVNIALHAANAVLLLLLLLRATGRVAPSLAVTALFALHPLRVESVAWIAERKDVLSAFFGLAALHAWIGYARRPAFGRYLGVLALLLLALLAKPMLVTLPALMLLMDLWPLRRLEGDAGAPRTTVRNLVIEKVPFLLLAGAAAGMTLLTARERGALVTLSDTPLPTRIAHAAASYAWYAWKTLWPTQLAVFYPYPTWATWQVGASAAVLAAAAVAAVATWTRARWVSVGLAWWAVALLPVCGLFQAGSQGMADRFTYLPSIGLLIAAAWTLDAIARTPRQRGALAAGALVAALALAAASARQIVYWKDARTLYEHTLAVTADNWIIEAELGFRLLDDDQPERAYAHFARSFALEPRFAKAAFGLGLAATAVGRPDEAEAHYRNALRVDPTFAKAHTNLGVLLFGTARIDEALHHLTEAVRKEPDATALTNLRYALEHAGVRDVDGYVQSIRRWSIAVAMDRARPGGETYGAGLMRALLAPHADEIRTCFAGTTPAPFNLYVTVAADGALEDITALPPTAVARCFGDELRTARVPAPPFAPFRAQMAMQFGG